MAPGVKLSLEQLETRIMPDAASVLASLQDSHVRTLAQKEFTRDNQLNRIDMMAIFREVAKEGKTVNAAALGDLATLVNNSSILNIPGYVENLSSKVIDYNPANKHFEGRTLVSNGRLVAGDSVSVLTDLIDKWFLGEDLPTPENAGGQTCGYAWAKGVLFAHGKPSDADIVQGEIGDCFFLSALGSAAAHDSSAITHMFISNGDGTYTVRFYQEIFEPDGSIQQVPDYVTVNLELPESSGQFVFANLGKSISSSSNVLWVALVEKAYAQLAAEGWSAGGTANSYRSINGGPTPAAMQQIMGEPVSWVAPLNSSAIRQMINDLNTGDLVSLDSEPFEPSSSHVIADHSYYVIGYDEHKGTFTALNPWGITDGTLHLTASQVERYFLDYDEAAWMAE
jgi:hypothetical protein